MYQRTTAFGSWVFQSCRKEKYRQLVKDLSLKTPDLVFRDQNVFYLYFMPQKLLQDTCLKRNQMLSCVMHIDTCLPTDTYCMIVSDFELLVLEYVL